MKKAGESGHSGEKLCCNNFIITGSNFCTADVLETQHYICHLMMLMSKCLSFPVSCNSHVWHKQRYTPMTLEEMTDLNTQIVIIRSGG